MILSPSTSSGEQEMLLDWLRQDLQNTAFSAGTNPNIETNTTMTVPEDLANQAHKAMSSIVVEAGDKVLWAEPDFDDRLKAMNQDLSDALNNLLQLVESMTAVLPAYFDTLHTLYTAYNLGKAALSFVAYCARAGKKMHGDQAESSKVVGDFAQRLLAAVEKQCVVIKKGMDEGWIDKVLESALAEGTFLDEDDFMEEWAGEVVESWRESVAGLAYLKA